MKKKNVIGDTKKYMHYDVDHNSPIQDQALIISEEVIYKVDIEILKRLIDYPYTVLPETPTRPVIPQLDITYSFDSIIQSTPKWEHIKKSDETFMGYVFGVFTGLLNERGYIFKTDYIYEPDKESVGNRKKVQNWVPKRSFTIVLEDIVKALFDKYLGPIIFYYEMLSKPRVKSDEDQFFTITEQTYRITPSSTPFQNFVIKNLLKGIESYFNSNSDKKIKFIYYDDPLEFTISLLT